MNTGHINSPEELYVYLRDSKTRIVDNIIFAGSPGHQVSELDYFLRKYVAGDIAKDRPYLWVQRGGAITEAMVEVYGPHFRKYNLGMIAHDGLYRMASQVTRMVPEMGVDVGLSHFKNSVLSREGTYVTRLADDIYYNVTNNAVLQADLDWFRLIARTSDFDPWTPSRPAIDDRLGDLLGGNPTRIAVVHFRKNSGNGGVAITPETLWPTLAYLRDCGYTIVKAGTEPYPESFAQFGVVNYSESAIRSFRNDLALLSHSSFNLINASGLETLGDLMGTPGVTYAKWHLCTMPYSDKMIAVPALLYDPVRQRLLSFSEQVLFFKTRQEWWEGQFFGWHVPIDRFVPRAPQPDEILEAVKEATNMDNAPRARSPLQERFNRLDENGPNSAARSRVSEHFLERFQALL